MDAEDTISEKSNEMTSQDHTIQVNKLVITFRDSDGELKIKRTESLESLEALSLLHDNEAIKDIFEN